jgi:hypothetical protein
MQNSVDTKIKGVAIWFYIIAGFQLLGAYFAWNAANANPLVAQAAMALVAFDLVLSALFVVFGYFGSKKQSWAFVAGLLLYALRAIVEFFVFFSPISLAIRAFLLYRMFTGLQACLSANRADQAMILLNKKTAQAAKSVRPFEMPQAPTQPAVAWTPPRAAEN